MIPTRKFFHETFFPKKYNKLKELLKYKIKIKGIWLALTCDGWTSTSKDSYLSLTCHFFSSEWEREDILLALHPLTASHTAEYLLTVINEILKEWEINMEKVISITHDQGAYINKASITIPFKSSLCYAHLMQNCLKEAFQGSKRRKITQNQELFDLLQKVRTVVEFFRNSTKFSLMLEKKQKDLGHEILTLILDVPTRWDSIYTMLSRLLKLKSSIMMILTETSCSVKDVLSSSDWNAIESLLSVLILIKRFTDTIQGDKGYLSTILPLINFISNKLDKLRETPDQNPLVLDFIDRIKVAITFRFNKHLIDADLNIATFLDPRFKEKGIYSERFLLTDITALLEKEYTLLYQSNRELFFNDESLKSFLKEPIRKLKLEGDEEDFWFEFENSNMIPSSDDDFRVEKIKTEIRQYTLEPRSNMEQDPGSFWRDKRKFYPILSVLAKKFLSHLPTSAYSERAFSLSEEVISKKRNRLLPENAEILVFLNKNQKYITNMPQKF